MPQILKDFNSEGNSQSFSSKKSSPVSIVTSKAQLGPPCSDIEMLSAQSQNGMEVAPSASEVEAQPAPKGTDSGTEKPPPTKEAKPPSEKKGGNTISEDTKALVKQALLNATQRRQRAGLCSHFFFCCAIGEFHKMC